MFSGGKNHSWLKTTAVYYYLSTYSRIIGEERVIRDRERPQPMWCLLRPSDAVWMPWSVGSPARCSPAQIHTAVSRTTHSSEHCSDTGSTETSAEKLLEKGNHKRVGKRE